MDADRVVLRTLGPVTVRVVTDEGEQEFTPGLTLAGEALIRSMAAHPDGVSVTRVKHECGLQDVRQMYDASNQLRIELRPFRLTVSSARRRAGYHITDLNGRRVSVQSDLDTLNVIAEKLPALRREKLDDLSKSLDVPSLEASLGELDEVIALWQADDQEYASRLNILKGLKNRKGNRLLIDIDNEVRHERARRSVALARQLPGRNLALQARNALADFDAPGDEAKELRKALRRELADVERVLVDEISSTHEAPDVFLAIPMLAADDYEASRHRAKRIVEALQLHCGVREVFWAGQTIEDSDHFEDPSVGLGRNMPYFRSATKFVMVYPEKVASGVLVEAGLAMALRAPAVYFVRDRSDLPWILRDVPGANDGQLGAVRVIEYANDDDLVDRIRTNGHHLFPNVRS